MGATREDILIRQLQAGIGAGVGYDDEAAQDAIGNNLLDSSTIDFTYNDGSGQITADVKPGIFQPIDADLTDIAGAAATDGDVVYRSGGHWISSAFSGLLSALGIRKTRTTVRLIATAALPGSPTYSNGTLGFGATLTRGSNGTLTVDGVVVGLGDKVLVPWQSSTFQNGLYVCTQVGGASTPWVLTRDPNFDTASEIIFGDEFIATAGTANAGVSYACLNTSAPTMGTTAITFEGFGGGIFEKFTARIGGTVKLALGTFFTMTVPAKFSQAMIYAYTTLTGSTTVSTSSTPVQKASPSNPVTLPAMVTANNGMKIRIEDTGSASPTTPTVVNMDSGDIANGYVIAQTGAQTYEITSANGWIELSQYFDGSFFTWVIWDKSPAVGGTLTVEKLSTGSPNAGTAETPLWNGTFSAQLAVAQRAMVQPMRGKYAANANSKTLRYKVDGTDIFTKTVTAGTRWKVEITLFYSGSGTDFYWFADWTSDNGSPFSDEGQVTAASLTPTLSLTGQGGAGSDIIYMGQNGVGQVEAQL